MVQSDNATEPYEGLVQEVPCPAEEERPELRLNRTFIEAVNACSTSGFQNDFVLLSYLVVPGTLLRLKSSQSRIVASEAEAPVLFASLV